MPETVKSFVDLVAFVGRSPGGEWEYVLWAPSINLSWTVK